MVRLAFLLCLLLAPAAGAQTEDAPPTVATEAPVLATPPDGTDAAATLPSVLPNPGLNDAPAPVAAVETDLVSLVLKAHPVVQGVMALLAASVFAVLTIFLFKGVEFWMAFAQLARDQRALEASAALTIKRASPKAGPLVRALIVAREEVAQLPPRLSADLRASARERLDLSLARIEADALRQLRSGTGLLATIGSVAPFVGLFGTVFGIMNSFLAIAATQTTNLAVVAPGIAEALLATGIGLAAAIPAVMLYNRALRRIAEFRHRLGAGTTEILRRFSRELDARMGQGA